MARHQKPHHNSKYLPLITGRKEENFDTYWHHTNRKEHKHTFRRTSSWSDPMTAKTMMAIGRIRADMRSAKDGIVLQRPSPINATNPRGPQQEGSRADRQGVHKTPRRPFSRGSLICIIIGHSGKPRHAHRTAWGTKTSSPKKKRAHSSEHHVHDTTTARLTTHGAQSQNRSKTPNHPTQRKTAEDPWPDIKKTNQSTIQHVCLSSQDLQKKTSTQIGLATSKKNTSTAPMDIIEVEPDDNKTMMTTSRMGADMRFHPQKTALYCNYNPPST